MTSFAILPRHHLNSEAATVTDIQTRARLIGILMAAVTAATALAQAGADQPHGTPPTPPADDPPPPPRAGRGGAGPPPGTPPRPPRRRAAGGAAQERGGCGH